MLFYGVICQFSKMSNSNLTKEAVSPRLSKYNSLLNTAEEIESSDCSGPAQLNNIGKLFSEINDIDKSCPLESRTKCLEENLLDSATVRLASGTFTKTVEGLSIVDHPYDPTEFANHILESLDRGNGWEQHLPLAQSLIKDLPVFNSIYGAIDIDFVPEKKVQQKQVREKEQAVAKSQPVKLTESQKEEEDIDDTVNLILKALKEEYRKKNFQPIGYFDFILDSNSFSQSIENMFYFAFLIKDGRANLFLKDALPQIEPVEEETLKTFRENDGSNTQMFASLSIADWKRFKPQEGILEKYQLRK